MFVNIFYRFDDSCATIGDFDAVSVKGLVQAVVLRKLLID